MMAFRHSLEKGIDCLCSKSYSTNIDKQRLFTSCVLVSKISCSRWKLLLPSLTVRVRTAILSEPFIWAKNSTSIFTTKMGVTCKTLC